MGAMATAVEADVVALVRSAAKGDEIAFARLVDAYHEDMRRICTFVARDPALADDAVQSAWSIAGRKLGTVRDPSHLRPWLLRVAVNETKKLLRKRGRRVAMESLAVRTVGIPRTLDPETGIESLDLQAALARLSSDERALLAMRYLAGFNATQLAEVLGITPSGTRNRLERLTSRLRRDLSDG
jgi:RNA polymerase sigma-70 factor, ECF subfamily